MTEITGNEVIKTEKFILPAKFGYLKITGSHSYSAAHDSRVMVSKNETEYREENWTAEREMYKDEHTSIIYRSPDERFPDIYEIQFDKTANKFSYNNRGSYGHSGVSLEFDEDGGVNFGPYTPRKIEGAGLYWDAHDFRRNFESFLRLASDPNFNSLLPKEALPKLCGALGQAILEWKEEINKVGPTGDLHLRNGQEEWAAYKSIRNDYADLPKA